MRSHIPLALLSALTMSSCVAIPTDPDNTLEQVQGGTLKVGVTEHLPYIDVHDDGAVTGTEADLLHGYADSIGAEVEWVIASEAQLAEKMNHREIHVVAGGLTKKTPWTKKFAITRPYDADRVFGIQMGENAFMVSLETYMAGRSGELK